MSSPKSKPTARGRNAPIVLLALAISVYVVTNGLELRLSAGARVAYGLILVWTGLLAFAAALRRKALSASPVPAVLLLWAVLMIVELLQVLAPANATLDYAITDYLITLLPVFMVFVLLSYRPTSQSLIIGMLAMGAAGILASMTAWAMTSGARFEAPQIIAVVVAWSMTLLPYPEWLQRHQSSFPWIRTTFAACVFFLFPVILASRSRTGFAVWVLSGIFLALLPGMDRVRRAPLVLVLMLLLGAGVLVLGPRYAEAGQLIAGQARMDELLSGKLDASTQVRVDEAQDVLETMRDDGSIGDYLVGFGHGASYEPNRSFIVSNVSEETGRVHNIHITPVLIFFRYGIVGFGLFTALLTSTTVAAWRGYRSRPDMLGAMLMLLVLMYLIDLLLRNSIADPVFAWAVAAAHYIGSSRTAERARGSMADGPLAGRSAGQRT